MSEKQSGRTPAAIRVSSLYFFLLYSSYDVGVKRFFDPFDTRLLRALHSRNLQKHS